MDLKLERSNILQVDFISKKGTLKLLPVGKKGKQKLIIGDDSGQVICYEFKKGEPQVVFQIRPFEGPISCVAIGGIGSKLDRIFISQGQKIIGVTKKGKEFFKLQTPLIEEINTITVYETKIYTGCEYIYNLYDDGNEIAYFINRDVINDIIIENITKENDFDTILACQDNCLRIVQGSQVISEIPTTSSTICVATSMNIEKTAKKGQVYLIYGMESGSFGEVRIDAKPDNIISYSYTWLVEDSVKRGAVSCLKVFDLRKTGIADIIVGRDDGRLEVYSRDGSGNRPKLIFTYDIEESIRGVECGLVNSTEYNEIIVAGYSGKLISFTTEPVNQRAQDDNYGRTIQTVNNENRIKYLQKEIDALRAKLDKERALVKKAPTATSMKPPPEFSINAKFLLDPTTAAYLLNIEIQNLIDIVIVRSPVVLDFLETGTSLVSITPPELLTDSSSSEDGAYKFVAAFRGQTADVRRLNVSIRSTEGEFGDVLVTVVTALNPTTKAAKVLRFPLKPLSLHSKIHILNEEQMSRPRNMIKFTGQMPLSVIHEWVQSLFPDIPPRLAEDSIEEKYFFKHTFTESVTICEFKKNELIFESESASTIVIVKENIVRFANARRVHIESALSSNSSSIQSFLSLIRPKLEYQISLARKMDLVDAVQEISMQTDASAVNDTLAWLSPEYVEILKQQDSIRQEFKARAKSLEYLSGIITDLFIDWNRLHSKDARNRIPALHQAILANDFDQLVDIFLVSDGRSSRK